MNRSMTKLSVVRHSLLAALSLLTVCCTRLESHVEQIDSRAVEVVTAGTGEVTVVFESGLGNDWKPWDDVASKVALYTRIFAYSRPGYGKSAPAVTPRDPLHIVEELRTLLVATGQTPPYVLVGHSTGGGYMELFAKAHPDEVLGVVLVDPRHRDFLSTCEQAGIKACGVPDSALSSVPAIEASEYTEFAKAPDEIRAAGSFGSYPVRVLTATDHPYSQEWEALWQSLLGSLAAEASKGKQIFFQGAGHHLEMERPDGVSNSILELVWTAGK